MIYKWFKWAYNENTEKFGVVPVGTENIFDVGGGLTVAHDLMEHYYKHDYGHLHFELMAMGASLWVRQDMYNQQIWGRTMFQVMEQIFDFAMAHDKLLIEPQFKTRPLKCESDEIDLQNFIRKGLKQCEYTYSNDINDVLVTQMRTHAIHWLRLGYNKAKKRYANYSRDELAHIFQSVETDADRFINYYGYQNLTVGDKICVSICSKGLPTITTHLQQRF